MPALYRTYRPKRFSEVVGQKHIVRTLRNAVQAGSVAHAYLFCGGRGLGKTTLARVLARALNCEHLSSEAEACLTCRVCGEIEAGNFMDLLEVDAASNTGVDNIRSLIESVRFQPTSGKYKVYIIDEAHMLSKGAWNALLKTLEEPPPRTVFVLATTEIAKVPATINSRAQRFDFRKFSENEIAAQLTAVLTQEHKELSSEIVSDISVAAQGGMRDALTLLDQVLALGDGVTLSDARAILGVTGRGVLIKLLGFLHLRDAASLPAYFEELAGTYFDAQAVVRDLLELLRDLLELRVTGTSDARELTEANGWFSETDLVFLIRQYLRAYKEVAQSPEQYLPFFLASVEAVQKLSGQAAVPQAPPVGISQKNAPAPGAVATAGVKKNSSEPPVVAKASTVAAPISPPVGVVDESVVREAWPALCDKVREVNGPLGTLVRNSPITAVEDGTIVLGVKYLFHKEQLESTKNRQLITSAITELIGAPVRIAAQFMEREEVVQNPAETISDALRIFGGELVE